MFLPTRSEIKALFFLAEFVPAACVFGAFGLAAATPDSNSHAIQPWTQLHLRHYWLIDCRLSGAVAVAQAEDTERQGRLTK
jgi:hypothetical protein